MPDPSAKGLVGQAMTRSLQDMLAEASGAPSPAGREPWPAWEGEVGDDEDVGWVPGDEAVRSVADVDHRLEDLHALACDHSAAQAANQLFRLP